MWVIIMKGLVVCLAAAVISSSSYAATIFEKSGLSLNNDFHAYSEMNNAKYSETGYTQNQSFLEFDLFGVNSIISNCDSNGNCLVQKNEKTDNSEVKSVN
ncbi:hypothetical protein SAMN04487865_10953 [Succinivibrio dextrinosolvens]|uniref:Uncharacterized protein n=2 Tax=Succinivibrionaceae TaxID=83763 RepID=A0A662ZEY1_9GAMM|nr:hypothetical protein SAMN04487865_10953 [Succinivibrio dextrinosolvens]